MTSLLYSPDTASKGSRRLLLEQKEFHYTHQNLTW